MTQLQFPDPALTGNGVLLRPWTETDLDDALTGSLDPLVPRFTTVPEDNTRANVELFAIADAETNRFLGPISIFRFNWGARHGEIGYWLAPWGRGRGAATTAVTLLSAWAFEHLPLDRRKLRINDNNTASLNVAARAGFTLAPQERDQSGIVTLHRQR